MLVKKLRLDYIGYGIYLDIRSRLPYYRSDFIDAWNYRVIPSTIFMFFTNLLPAIAFSQDMFNRTHDSYGVNEVLLSSAIAGVVFGLFAGQPLCIVGVTGPISIFSYTIYDLIKSRETPFLPFMCWIYLWSMVMHLIIAFGNLISYLKIISTFSCEVFGFFICIIYLQKGVAILNDQFRDDIAAGFCSVMIGVLMVVFGVGATVFGRELHYFRSWTRKLLTDYGTPLSVIFFTGFVHFGGYLSRVNLKRLPITKAFEPTLHGPERPHGWFIHFWPPNNISTSDVFLALPFAILLTFLFYFDHNVSSLMCQSKEYPLKKPSSFHWDFLLLGLTTGLAGIIGIPAPNGLIPQAPLHTESLVVYDHSTGKKLAVVEQRLTNILQGLFILVMMTRPFLVLLGLVPQAVLSGLFFILGINGLHGNMITNKIRYIFLDKNYIDDSSCPDVFRQIKETARNKWFYIYLILQLIAAGFEVGITLTKGAVGFPGVLMFFAICVEYIWPLFIPSYELAILDSEVADEDIIKNLQVTKIPQKT